MRSCCLLSLLALLVFNISPACAESVNKGGILSLSIGNVSYNHINIPPAWAVETPDIIELVGGQGTTSIRVKGVEAGVGIVRCFYATEKYDSTIKMWVVEQHYDKFFYVTVIDNEGSSSGSTPTPDPESGNIITMTNNLTMYVGQEYNFQINFPEEIEDYYGHVDRYSPSDSKCLAVWTYDSNYFQFASRQSQMKSYGLKAISPTNSTTILAKYATRKLDNMGRYVYTDRQEKWIVKIKPLDVTPESIGITNEEIELFVGEKVNLTAEILPSGAPQEFVWINKSPELISVNSTYKTDEGVDYDGYPQINTDYGVISVTANAQYGGEARIIVQCPFDKVSSKTITVKVKYLPVQSISLPQSVNLEQGTRYQISPTIIPVGADTNLTWSVEDEDIVYVDNTGGVYGLKPGTTVVYAESENGVKTSTQVTVIAHHLQIFSSAGSGTVQYNYSVSLTASREKAEIFYTLNGDDPTKDALLYTDPIKIDRSLSLKAKAFLEGYECSEILTRDYQVKLDISANLNSGTIKKDQQLILSCTNPNASIYYTLNGDTPNQHSIKYTSPIIVEKSCSIKAVAICEGCTDSEILEREYQIRQVVAVIYPQTTLITSTKKITISVTPSDAIVTYTTDGTEPTKESQLYSSGFYLNKTSTLKVLAYKDGYDDVRCEQTFILLEGNGSSNLPYVINTKEEFNEFAKNVNNGNNYSGTYFKLGNDINLNPGKTITAETKDAEEWTPIGNKENYFRGVFDGDGHTITGIYINQDNQDCIGLFGYVNDGEIRNLTIRNSFIHGLNDVGALLGFGSASITNCFNYGHVEGNMYVGGISGSSSVIRNCCNYGNVIGTDDCVGGIIGYAGGAIYNCANYGTVRGTKSVGGICGEVWVKRSGYTKYVNNCFNMGDIYGGTCGGIVGYCNSGYTSSSRIGYLKMNVCVNYGKLQSETRGAVSGRINKYTSMSYCYYLNTSCDNGIGINNASSSVYATSYSEENIKSVSFINKLNSGIGSIVSLEHPYCNWKAGKEGYPILDFIDEQNKEDTPADVDGDSMVDIADAVWIVNHIVGKATPTFNSKAADVNNDGVVDIADAVRIVNLIVGKIDALGREHEIEMNLPNPE